MTHDSRTNDKGEQRSRRTAVLRRIAMAMIERFAVVVASDLARELIDWSVNSR
ncbi:hypothetical protein [Streptomyces sp. NPDC059278]|uniref:hypothetical protein n=1 Tax=Streptomyces sp. NPDC059278 TaxID=3346801 RepID=UPI0036B26B4B